MSRRRSTPWIHRQSRLIIGAIAFLGSLDTGYLTFEKLTGGKVVCSADIIEAFKNCNDVLQSPYANVFGLPLSLFGCLAYISMMVFALAPLLINTETQKDLRSTLETWSWLLLFAGGTAMTIFSGYLMYLLAFKIGALCPYCIASAAFSVSLFVLAIIGHAWEDMGQLFFTGIVVGMITLITTLGLYASVSSPSATNPKGVTPIPPITEQPKPRVGWEITTTSGESEIALARHLKKVGFKMYGAYWCPHCYEQKQLLGKVAFEEIDYTECANDGKNSQAALCTEKGVKSYPSWEINGKIEAGVLKLEKLAELSGYQGPKNFKYFLPGG